MAQAGHPDPAIGNRQILEDLTRGATAVELRFSEHLRSDGAASPGGSGINCTGKDELASLLKGVHLHMVPISLDAGVAALAVAKDLLKAAEGEAPDPSAYAIHVNSDPVGTLGEFGRLPRQLEQEVGEGVKFACGLDDEWRGVSVFRPDERVWHNGGGTDGLSLGAVLSTGVFYLRQLIEAGLEPTRAAQLVRFRLICDADFFGGVVKLRAFRQVWGRVLGVMGVQASGNAVRIDVQTSERMMTRRDPWVNLLRTTVAGFAAGIGGAESICILPFTHALGLPSDLARRLARNTHVILQEESGIGRVQDPAGGAWALESMTRDLAEAVWLAFQRMESTGGIVESLRRGDLQADLLEQRRQLSDDIGKRITKVTGVSEFPDLQELPVEIDGFESALPGNRGTLVDKEGPHGERAEAVPAMRLGEEFEALRDAADLAREAGREPKVLLGSLGKVSDFTARATFAANFFEAGGIEAVTNEGFRSLEELVAAVQETGVSIVCLCSSDVIYQDEAAPAAEALRALGVKVILAGHPGEARSSYEAAGITDFIFMGCDVLEALRDLHVELGVQ